jgi:anti-sigma B factor antagonist
MQSLYDDMPDGDWNAVTGFTIDVQPDSRGARVALAGELDMTAAAELDRQLSELTDGLSHRLLIDLSELRFMDSTGLASLLRAQRLADARGDELVLRAGSAQVQKLFELTGTLERFTFEG